MKKERKVYGWQIICPANKVTSQEAAEYLGLPRNVVYLLCRKGVLPFTKKQSMYFFEKKDLLYWNIQNQPERVIKPKTKKRNLFKLAQHYFNILVMLVK